MESAAVSDLSQRLAHDFQLSLQLVTAPMALPDPLLRVALYSGGGAIAVSFVLIVVVVLLRLVLLARGRRERRFVAAWRPLIVQCMEGVPQRLPPLAAADRSLFLRLWNHYHESVRGAAKGRLNQLAEVTGMDAVARGMLARRSLRDRLLAVVTLGHLGDKTAWHALRALTEDASPMLSLAAARSMLKIEAAAVLPWFVPLAAARQDWPLARVTAILDEAGPDRVTPALAVALEDVGGGDAERVSRLLRMCEVAYVERLARAVRRILERTAEPRIIADALQLLRDPHDVGAARRHASHESWQVRVAAAKALGRLGVHEDRALLTDMLGDANWWVRHRAAQALAGMPSVTLEALAKIRDTLPDAFAVQALAQAIAEKS